MHQVEISGRYGNKAIQIHRSFPAQWKEMDPWHLDTISEVLTSGQPDEKHLEMILHRWLKLPPSIYFNMDRYYIEELKKHLTFLFESNTLEKVLFPQFTLGTTTYHGPKDAFVNISFVDWIVGEHFFQKYQKSKSDQDLNCVLFSMYRPNHKDLSTDSPEYRGDLRELINDHTVEEKSKVFSALSKKDRMKYLITYMGNRNAVMQRFQPVFEDVDRKGIHDPYFWSGVLVDMTGSKWLDRAAVEREKVYNIFIHWHQNILRMEAYEEEMEKAKSK